MPVAQAVAQTAAAGKPSAAAFDAQLKVLTGPDLVDASTEQYDHAIEVLGSALPAADARRKAQFQSIDCAHSRWMSDSKQLEYALTALQLAQKTNDVESQVRAWLCIATYRSEREGAARGIQDINQALALLQTINAPQLHAEAWQIRGDLQSLIGEQGKAVLDFQRSRAGYRQAGVEHEPEIVQRSLAIAYRRMGDHALALPYFQASEKRELERGNWEGATNAQLQMAYIHMDAGNPESAREAFQRAIDLSREHGISHILNPALLGLAEASIELKEPQAAMIALDKAEAGFLADADTGYRDMQLSLRGRAYAALGQHREALRRYDSALPLVRKSGNDRYLSKLHLARARSLEALGDASGALAEYKQHFALETSLQQRMRVDQSTLLQYEYEVRKKEFENRELRNREKVQAAEVRSLERVRRWQSITILLGGLLAALLGMIAMRQLRASRQLGQLAMIDPLTSVASRLSILQSARRAMDDARQAGRALSFLCLDIDHFKSINDNHGHQAGDTVLTLIALACKSVLRQQDLLGRIGGEEFLIVCPNADAQSAHQVAERLRQAVAALDCRDIAPGLSITTSVGVAQWNGHETLEEVMERADAALYRAKQNGRNRVESAA